MKLAIVLVFSIAAMATAIGEDNTDLNAEEQHYYRQRYAGSYYSRARYGRSVAEDRDDASTKQLYRDTYPTYPTEHKPHYHSYDYPVEYKPTYPEYKPSYPEYKPSYPEYKPSYPEYKPHKPEYDPSYPAPYYPTYPQYKPSYPEFKPYKPDYQTYSAHYPSYSTY